MDQPEASPPLNSCRRLDQGEAIQLVDVREDQELALARFPHPVVHLPLSRSAEWMGDLDTRLPRDRMVVVLCHAGVRSWHFGCWLLQEHGLSSGSGTCAEALMPGAWRWTRRSPATEAAQPLYDPWC